MRVRVTIALTICLTASAGVAAASDLALNPGVANADVSSSANDAGSQTAAATAASPAPPARHKSEVATVLLGLLIPGGANFYTGNVGKGLLFLATGVGGSALMLSGVDTECTYNRYSAVCSESSAGKLYGGLGIIAAAHVLDIVTGMHRAADINSGKISKLQRFQLSVSPAGKTAGIRVAYNLNFR